MSHIGHIQSQVPQEDMPKVLKWANYDAAKLKFEEHRKHLIHQIMHMEIKEGTDFFAELHQKIDQFKNHPVMDLIAKSVITGEALEEVHKMYIAENVHEEVRPEEPHEPKQLTAQTPTHQIQTEARKIPKAELIQAPSEIKDQMLQSEIESKIQEPIPTEEKQTPAQASISNDHPTPESPLVEEKPPQMETTQQPTQEQTIQQVSETPEPKDQSHENPKTESTIPTQESLVEAPQQHPSQEARIQSPQVVPKEEQSQQIQSLIPVEVVSQKEQDHPKEENTKPTILSIPDKVETTEETPAHQLSQESKFIEGSEIFKPQIVEPVIEENKEPSEAKVEEEKLSTVKQQTASEEPKVESKVEQKIEGAKQEKPEVPEAKKEKQKQQEQKHQNQEPKEKKNKKRKK